MYPKCYIGCMSAFPHKQYYNRLSKLTKALYHCKGFIIERHA